jgi:site-specific recombinase XerD
MRAKNSNDSTPHVLREETLVPPHVCDRGVEDNTPLPLIQRDLGYASLETTQIYGSLGIAGKLTQNLTQAFRKLLNPLDGGSWYSVADL